MGWQGLYSSASCSLLPGRASQSAPQGVSLPLPPAASYFTPVPCCPVPCLSPAALLFPACRHLISLPTTLYSTDKIRRELGMQFLDRKTTLRDQVEGMKRRGLLPGFKG